VRWEADPNEFSLLTSRAPGLTRPCMDSARFKQLTSRYAKLRIAVLGDVCLDRYLDIDPARGEISIETGLPVHNVVKVRSQPGAAGTILNNLLALGIGRVHAIGLCGKDGEGFELMRALRSSRRVHLDGFVETPLRCTFTYTKPLVHEPGRAPRELNRLDRKNWTRTPPVVERKLIGALRRIADSVDAIIVMDQVDVAETGVVTAAVRGALGEVAAVRPKLPILADSRRSLRGWPRCIFKMNRNELGALIGRDLDDMAAVPDAALELARANGRPVFITLAEHGMIAADPGGPKPDDDEVVHRMPALPVRGEIDVVGAGDAVSANVAAALAAGADVVEAVELAGAAASAVIHQIGTTGVASVRDLRMLAVR
jgi:rfaE bifunctional protein kinase chain/domain